MALSAVQSPQAALIAVPQILLLEIHWQLNQKALRATQGGKVSTYTTAHYCGSRGPRKMPACQTHLPRTLPRSRRRAVCQPPVTCSPSRPHKGGYPLPGPATVQRRCTGTRAQGHKGTRSQGAGRGSRDACLRLKAKEGRSAAEHRAVQPQGRLQAGRAREQLLGGSRAVGVLGR